MNTPRLNRKLVLESPDREADGSGGFSTIWRPLGSVWAEVTVRVGREGALSGEPISKVSYRIVVRATPFGAPDRPKPDQRFRDGDRVFLISAVAEVDHDGRFLTCFATEEIAV